MKKLALLALMLVFLLALGAVAAVGGNIPPGPSGSVTVMADPLWSFTGVDVCAGQQVRITVPGPERWSWGGGVTHGADGYSPWNQPATWDRFLYVAKHGEMLGYVGDDPYKGQWGQYYYDWYGDSDPRSGQHQLPGYLRVGIDAVTPQGFNWTADHDGWLWLGFNDDAVCMGTGDNGGYLYAFISVDGQPVASPPPNSVTVTSNPLWTNTGVTLLPGEHVRVVVPGPQQWTWGGGVSHGVAGYSPWTQPNTWDRFLYVANHGEMVAYIGNDPYQGQWGQYYYDWYGEGDSRSGQHQLPGYLRVGTDAATPDGFNWTADRGGLLWLGFNDDSESECIDDNTGYVFALVYVNAKPVAEAGPNQMIHWNDTVQLDGTGSHDSDDDPLTYSWAIVERPEGSAATLSAPHSATPSFAADAMGTYRVRLTVSDPYQTSDPDYVVIDTSDTAPLANGGPNQMVPAGPGGVGSVTLDGSGSHDADNDPIISYTWTWNGGSASGVGPTISLPVGTTVISLVVSDGLLDSAPATVSVQVNRPPVAVAGQNIQTQAGPSRTAQVPLDGSGSYDPDGDALTYQWTWQGGSGTGAKPTVTLPQGWTNVKLVVNDGYADSQPAFVNVFVNGLTATVNGGKSIQDAIDAAHDWDTIVVGPGSYEGCITFSGKKVTVRSSDGANRTIIQGDQSIFGCPLVTFDNNETPESVLDGFSLQGPQVAYKGTGIYIHNCSPTIRNCIIRDCVADDRDDRYPDGIGGAMWVYGTLGRPVISNCLIEHNLATSQNGCGGVYVCCGAQATLVNCTIANNSSNLGPGGLTVKADSVVLLKDSIVWGNVPDDMAAVPSASVTVQNSDTGGSVWPGTGNLSADPLFIGGALGNYYLAVPGQGGSPCLDAGSTAAASVDAVAGRITQTDGESDSGQVDIGYHYPRTPAYIQSARPSDAQGIVKVSFDSGEKVCFRVDYTVQGKATDRRYTFVAVKVGGKTFKKRVRQTPGNYTAVVRCKAFTVHKTSTKAAVVTVTLRATVGGPVLASDTVKASVVVHP